jgi:hypothetical protein
MSHNVRNGTEPSRATRSIAAGTLTLYHSRYLAKTLGHKASPRCAADKLAIWLTPAWLYLPMVPPPASSPNTWRTPGTE